MFEGDPTATTPMSPVAPPPAPVRKSGVPAGRVAALGLLAFALAAFSGRIDLGALVTAARSYVDQTAPAARTTTNSSDSAAVAAVKDVISRANQAQVQAYARNDPTLMRATATDSYYQELLQTNQGIQSSGARSIELVSLDWVEVTTSGTTAQASTNETWRTTYTDGSVAESTDRNDYTLVLHSGLGDEQLEQLVRLRRERRNVHFGHGHVDGAHRVGEFQRSRRDLGRDRRALERRSHSGRNADNGRR